MKDDHALVEAEALNADAQVDYDKIDQPETVELPYRCLTRFVVYSGCTVHSKDPRSGVSIIYPNWSPSENVEVSLWVKPLGSKATRPPGLEGARQAYDVDISPEDSHG